MVNSREGKKTMLPGLPAIREYWNGATPMKFDDEAWTYLQKRTFRYELQDYMHDSFRFEGWDGKKVLEIGCGSGIDAVEFARHGADVTVIDIAPNAVTLAKKLAVEANVQIEVIEYDGHTLPYSDSQFDLVYSYGVLHHIPWRDEVLREVLRVLKPDGRMMAMLYNRNSLLFAYSILYQHGTPLRWLQVDSAGLVALGSKYSERNIGCPYTECLTKSEVLEMLPRLGFKDVTVDVRYDVIDTPTQRKVKLTIDPKLELGWHLIVKGAK